MRVLVVHLLYLAFPQEQDEEMGGGEASSSSGQVHGAFFRVPIK